MIHKNLVVLACWWLLVYMGSRGWQIAARITVVLNVFSLALAAGIQCTSLDLSDDKGKNKPFSIS
jgi:hypothetical protein